MDNDLDGKTDAADTLVDLQEYVAGTNPKVANADGLGGNDRADTAAVAGDPDGDTFTTGVELVMGTDPNLECINSSPHFAENRLDLTWERAGAQSGRRKTPPAGHFLNVPGAGLVYQPASGT